MPEFQGEITKKAPQNYHPTLVLKLSDLAFRIQLIGQQRSNFVDQGTF